MSFTELPYSFSSLQGRFATYAMGSPDLGKIDIADPLPAHKEQTENGEEGGVRFVRPHLGPRGKEGKATGFGLVDTLRLTRSARHPGAV